MWKERKKGEEKEEKGKIGLVTVGQTPRDDVTPEILDLLPSSVSYVEVGALDGFDSAEKVMEEIGAVEGEPRIVTRMRDGTSVSIKHDEAVELLKERMEEMEEVSLLLLLCTGSFPKLDTSVPVLKPGPLLRAWVKGITEGGEVGVMIPDEEQVEQAEEKWSEFQATFAAASPYGESEEIRSAAGKLKEKHFIALDCIGYDSEMKSIVEEVSGSGVLLSRSVLGKTASEIMGDSN